MKKTLLFILSLILATLLWFIVSFIEQNFVILFTFCILLLCFCFVFVKFNKTIRSPVLIYFSLGILINSVFSISAWYLAESEERRYLTGTNSDSFRFWEKASLGYEQASLWFEDPFFPRLNVLFYNISSYLGEPSYLINSQIVIFFGSLCVVLFFLFVNEFCERGVANYCALLLLMSPTRITFSTGLMRDIVILFFGLLFMYSIVKLKKWKYQNSKLLWVGISLIALISLHFLRTISMVSFLLCGAIFVIFQFKTQRRDKIHRGALIGVVLILVFAFILSYNDRSDRFSSMFEYAVKVRLSELSIDGAELDQNGITTIIGNKFPVLYFVIAPINLMQPFPFYNWDPPYYEKGSVALMDVVLGFGGLFNQIFFVFYLSSFFILWKFKNKLALYLFYLFPLCVGALTFLGLGQIRMMMSQVYFCYYLAVAYSLNYCMNFKMGFSLLINWLGLLFSFYLFYYFLKIKIVIILLILVFLILFLGTCIFFNIKNFFKLVNFNDENFNI
jgi:hypothetical protein